MQLVLTHTHAGVNSLRQKFQSTQVQRSQYELDTIAGWALRLAKYYPKTTKFCKPFPEDSDYDVIYRGVADLLRLPFMRKVIRMSYTGVIVDEYQDCNVLQHKLVLSLAESISCRILGDPLQGIFGFGNAQTLVDWQSEVKSQFEEIPPLTTPFRWQNGDVDLGRWLIEIRSTIRSGQPIDLANAPVRWTKESSHSTFSECMRVANRDDETVVVVHPNNKNRRRCHFIARGLKGRYQSIEEMDAKSLQEWADKFDNAKNNERAIQLIKFASDCCTKVSGELDRILKKFKASDVPDFTRTTKHRRIADILLEVSKDDDFLLHMKALQEIRSSISNELSDAHMYRYDLWYSMIDALTTYEQGEHQSLKSAAWEARQRQKYIGRRNFQRIVSRTLLIKGLEFDHAILLEADKFDSNNLYVALTRASKSVTVISPEPILRPRLRDRNNN